VTLFAEKWQDGHPAAADLSRDSSFFEPAAGWDGLSYANLLAERAAQDPEAIFVDDGDKNYTLAEVWLRARHLAAAIDAIASPDGPVYAVIRNNADYPIIMFAVLASGRSMVPVDATAAIERRNAMLEDCAATLIVACDANALGGLRVGTLPVVMFDPAPLWESDFVPREPDPGTPLFIFYTSGSTGRPKGVAMGPFVELQTVVQMARLRGLRRGDVFVSPSAIGAFGLLDPIFALIVGGKVCPLDLRATGIVDGLRFVERVGATVLFGVPSVLRVLAGALGAKAAFAQLRVASLGGEPIHSRDLELFRGVLPATCSITLAMASTEAGRVLAWVIRDELVLSERVPAGYPALGRRVAIIHEDGRSVEPGEIGEIVVSDEQVAYGDWRNGKIDDTRFRARPDDPGPRTYHTGDLVLLRADGILEFRGRLDRMVKVRGLQVDLAEVESAIRSYRSVADAAVITSQAGDNSATLSAFVTLRGGSAVDKADLRAWIVAHTALHMVPHHFHVLEELPRLHNGKPNLVLLTEMTKVK
jgi:acyl-coenzyme A synthetase/AMP-(fatty) acid ligase